MRIEVTQRDIDNGVRDHCDKCAVALAIRRATGQDWQVAGPYAVLADGGYFRESVLPQVVAQFVRDFDNELAVHPFSFEFEPNPRPE